MQVSRLSSVHLQVRPDFNEQALQVSNENAPCLRVIKIVLFIRTEYKLCLHLQVHMVPPSLGNNSPVSYLYFLSCSASCSAWNEAVSQYSMLNPLKTLYVKSSENL